MRAFIILIVGLFCYSSTIAQPKIEGFASDRLARITAMVENEIKENHIPGAVALITHDGEVVYHEAFGAYKKDAIFRIASQTKAITSTAVMMLWEQGLFRLDDPISKYIPAFTSPQVIDSFNESDTTYTTKKAEREITIRDLLTHQSGIGYGVIDGDPRMRMIYKKAGITDLFTTEKITIEESVLKLAQLPLHHNPGEKFTYSEGLDVLGYLIEIISGMPFDEYLRKNIFDPLEMEDTWFYLPTDKHERLVPVQHMVNGKWENYPITFYDTRYPITGAKTFFSGGAGLSSTAADYAKFLQMYLNGGKANGQQLLSRTTIATIMQNQTGDHLQGNGSEYGLAFGIVDHIGLAKGGRGGVGTFDWGGYFNTQYFADPSENVIGILMKQTQGNTGDQSGWRFRQMVFAAIND